MFKEALLDNKMSSTRLLIALSSLTWGLLLFMPGHLFSPVRHTYYIMAMIASEEVWAAAFTLHGVIAIVSLKMKWRTPFTLVFDSFLGCILWTSSTAACFVSYWDTRLPLSEAIALYNPPAAMSGELWVALFSWWFLIRHWAGEGES